MPSQFFESTRFSPEINMKIAVTLRENEMNAILSENHERKIKVRSPGCHLSIGKLEF